MHPSSYLQHPFSSAVGTFRFAHFCDSWRDSVISHWALNLPLPDDAWRWAASICLLTILNPLWRIVQVFCPFINEFSLFFLLTFNNSLCFANMDSFGMMELCRVIWGRVSERGHGHWDCGFLESVVWPQHSLCMRDTCSPAVPGGARTDITAWLSDSWGVSGYPKWPWPLLQLGQVWAQFGSSCSLCCKTG